MSRQHDEVVAVDDLVRAAVGELVGALPGDGPQPGGVEAARGPWRTPRRRGRRSRPRRRRRSRPSRRPRRAGAARRPRRSAPAWRRRRRRSCPAEPTAKAIHSLRAGKPIVSGLDHRARRRARRSTASAQHVVPVGCGDDGPHAGPGRDLGRRQLRCHAAAPPGRARAAGQRFEALVDLDDLLDQRGRGVEAGVGGEQAGHVGEQHQQVGADEVGDRARRGGRCRRSGSRRRRWRRSR